MLALLAPLAAVSVEPVIDSLVAAEPPACRQAALAVVVVQDGHVVLAKGYNADVDTTPFRIASVTKNVTATAVMQLVERGQLDLDADVNRYLTRFRLAAPITARQLLTHTAALDNSWIGCAAESDADVDITAHLAAHVPEVIGTPGEIASYNNHHYVVLGAVVEAITGERFDDYVRDHIFAPAGMTHSGFTGGPRGYTVDDGALVPAIAIPPTHDVPASSLVTTASDMGRYMAAHLVSPATMRAMQDGGLGFFAEVDHGWRTVGHDGDLPGFAAELTLVPELDLGVFVVANVSADECTVPFGATGALLEKLYPRTTPPPVASPIAGDAARVAGTYRSLRRSWRTFLDVTELAGRDVTVTAAGDALRIGRGTYVETAPLVFERTDGARRAVFRDGRMSIGVLGYERIAWYDGLLLHRIVLFACMLVFLVAAIGLPIRRRRAPSRLAWWLGWSTAAAPVLFALGAVVGTLRAGVFWFAYGIPAWFAALLVLPIAGALSAAALAVLLVLRRARGIPLTVVAAAGLVFAWWLHHWNLLGWHY